MRVPTVESPSAQREVAPGVQPNADFTTRATPELFGGGPEAEKATREMQGAVGEGVDLATKLRQNADQVRVNDLTLKAANYKDTLMMQAKQNEGDNALAQIQPLQDQYDKYVQELSKGVNGEYQGKLWDERSTDLKKSLTTDLTDHAGQAMAQKDTQTHAALTEVWQNNMANAKTPEERDKAKQFLLDQNHDYWNRRFGYSPDNPIVQKSDLDTLSVPTANIIKNMASNDDIKGAYAMLGKAEVNETRVPGLMDEIRSIDVDNRANRIIRNIGAYLKPDGTPDYLRLENITQNMKPTDTPFDEKQREQLTQKVLDMAKNYEKGTGIKQTEKFEVYGNNAEKWMKAGVSLGDALKMTDGIGASFSDAERAVGRKIVTDIYNKPSAISNVGLANVNKLMDLMETRKDFGYNDIRTPYLKGDINQSDFRTLSQYWKNIVTNGQNPEMKSIKDKALADAKRITGKENKTEFEYMVNQWAATATSPDDFRAKVNAGMKKEGGILSSTYSFKNQYAKEKPEDDKWNEYGDRMGEDTVGSVVDSIASNKKTSYDKVSTLDVYNFGDQIQDGDNTRAGAEKLAQGTVGNTAIQALIRNRKSVDVDSINNYIANAKKLGIDLNAQ